MSLKRKDHPDAVSLVDAGGGTTVALAQAFNQKKFQLFEVSEDILKEVRQGAIWKRKSSQELILCCADETRYKAGALASWETTAATRCSALRARPTRSRR